MYHIGIKNVPCNEGICRLCGIEVESENSFPFQMLYL